MSSFDDAISKAIDQVTDYGLQVDTLDTSGKLVRVPVEGDKGRKKSGWYVAHEFRLMNGSTVIVGRYGNWKLTAEARQFEADYQLSIEDLSALKKKQADNAKIIEAERKRAASDAEKRANEIWSDIRQEGNSDYLKNKGVRGFYIGYMRDSLVIPLRTITGNLVGVQFIYPDGSKKFLTGTAKKGAFHLIGDVENSKKVIITEGYATAASIYAATKIPCVVAFDAGNLLPVAQAFRKRHPDLKIIIAADDDHATDGNPGITKATATAKSIDGVVVSPEFEDKKDKTDFNDMDQEQGLKAVNTCIREQLKKSSNVVALNTKQSSTAPEASLDESNNPRPEDDWRQKIQRNDKGNVLANLANTYLYLTNLPEWKGVIAYDEFATRVVCLKTPPFGGEGERLWADNDDARTAVWLSMKASFSPKVADVQKVVELVAQDNSFHKVREYLNGVKWDGKPRVENWLIDYFGALPELSSDASQNEFETSDQLKQYLIAAGTKWLIGAVARIMRPGCKMDNVLILEGNQGAGKSSALKILFSEEWFNETMVDLNDKDARQMLCGKWGIELAELDSFNKADSNKAKGFFSTSVDTYRQAYGRRMQDIPRQCVFAGTTNQHEYFRDDTNRRYWPVDCKKINRKQLIADRDQLWAEALALYKKGVKWWPLAADKHLFDVEQQKRRVEDPWYEKIAEWLNEPERREGTLPIEITINQILTSCIGMDISRIGERMERVRVGKIMHQLGWVKRQRSKGKDRYYYVRGREALNE